MKRQDFLKMNQKVLLYFLFFIFIGNNATMFAQDYLDICATNDADIIASNWISPSNGIPLSQQELEPLVFNIYFWGIKDQFGTPHPNDITEQKVLAGVQLLNISFNPYKIYFKYRGFESFNSPPDVTYLQFNYDCPPNGECVSFPFDPVNPCNNSNENSDPDGFAQLSRCQINDLIRYRNEMGYVKPDMINVYVPQETTDFGGNGGTDIVLHPNNLETLTFVHEIGHTFGLQHTWVDWNSSDPHGCEHVTRIPNDTQDIDYPLFPYYNADSKGDKITDTAAMPEFRREHCILNNLPLSQCNNDADHDFEYYDTDNCLYTGADNPYFRSDCQETIYEIDVSQSQNFMSYAPSHCFSNFTDNQVLKMRFNILGTSNLYNRMTDVPALFEPYRGEYYVAGPIIDPRNKPLFQPGFNYKFLECSCECPEPSPYADSFSYTSNALLTIDKYETEYSSITHPNHSAIQIDLGFITGEYALPHRCYDNWNYAPNGGKITKFNDVIFNANVTITPQDSTAINNPNLVNDLQPGLYKIEKTYVDGAIQQTVILKENN